MTWSIRRAKCRPAMIVLVLLSSSWSVVRGQENEQPGTGQSDAAERFSDAQVAFFEKQVLPILQKNCFECHGAEPKLRGNLRLTSRDGILKGGDYGPAVVFDKPDESPFLEAIHYDGLEMPPKGRLPAGDVKTLEKWIEARLPWSRETSDYGVEAAPEEGHVDDGRDYWAYQPVVNPPIPLVTPADRVVNPVDAFVLERLRQAGIAPVGEADRATLVRRAYYDLLGLPPTPQQVDEFVRDESPDAYERLIDRLLESPQYGEKWGRFWLDLVRFAETHGYERDSVKPYAWKYRDYVIESFNADKPYNQFLIEQLAGDELDEVTAETLTATGFYRLGIWDDEPADRLQARYDILDDIVSTTSQVMLGMTLGCARCHDHKKDPLPQTDYYQFLAYFHDVTPMNRENLRRFVTDADRAEHQRQLQARQDREARMYEQVFQIEQTLLKAIADDPQTAGKVLPNSDLADVKFRFYRDTFESLPDFSEIKFETSGSLESNRISLSPASRKKAIGLVFDASLKVPAAGEYTFTAESTDGVRLLIDGRVVLERPGRGRGTVSGTVSLRSGLLPLTLEYFNSYEDPLLNLTWHAEGMSKRSLTDAGQTTTGILSPDARTRAVPWRYTLKQPVDGWVDPEFNDRDWNRGPGGFGQPGTPNAVVKTEWTTTDIWLRRSFKVDVIPPSLSLDLHHDEDVEVYLNGTRIFEADGYVTEYQRIPLGADAQKLLKPGNNVLAVHCRQTGGGQYIDVGLVADDGTLDVPTLLARHGKRLLGPERLAEHARLTRELEQLRKQPLPEAGQPIMAVEERGRAQTHVLIRGSAHAPGDAVSPLIPAVLQTAQPQIPELPESAPSSRKRLTLARWIASPENPLTARVFMNRLWQMHFGRGIVPTPNDFGKLGEMPTHPELLTWLAREFMDGGWKIKRMHKLLMMSHAYRRASTATDSGLAQDPANTLLWRFNMRRLSAEELRDSILSITGELNLKSGGPGVYTLIPEEVLRGQSRPGAGWGQSPPEEAARRSVYIHMKRSLLVPILEMHDLADTDSSCPVRYTTTVPTQSLGMLNGDFTNRSARALARRLEQEAPGNRLQQIRRAIRLTTGREPTENEVSDDDKFLDEVRREHGLTAEQALEVYCLLALNTNEFVYLD